MKTLDVLYSMAGIDIATKSLWEAWGKPAIRRTRMKLQLADGHLEVPLGLLEGIIITTCGIKFTHTFAVVDFGRKTAYDLILGRPFMRQSKLIQDWGKNHLYLKHAHALIRVNTADHSYKDVK